MGGWLFAVYGQHIANNVSSTPGAVCDVSAGQITKYNEQNGNLCYYGDYIVSEIFLLFCIYITNINIQDIVENIFSLNINLEKLLLIVDVYCPLQANLQWGAVFYTFGD